MSMKYKPGTLAGKLIRQKRMEIDCKIDVAARLLGMSEANLSRIERGVQTPKNVGLICEVLLINRIEMINAMAPDYKTRILENMEKANV
jgi:DNA-binding transcriptional regulator YiaG